MGGFWESLGDAVILILAWDRDLIEIIALSLRVTLTATAIACAIGLPLGAVVGAFSFPGRAVAAVILNSLMGLPPVVVGLFVYLMLSASGPLGVLGLLYTPTAMIIAQAILITPIVAALTRQVIEDLHREYAEQFLSLQVGPLDRVARAPVGCPLQSAHGRAGGFWPCGGRGRCSAHRGRQHQPRDPSDDDSDRAGDVERKPPARPRAWGRAARHCGSRQLRRDGAPGLRGAGRLCVSRGR